MGSFGNVSREGLARGQSTSCSESRDKTQDVSAVSSTEKQLHLHSDKTKDITGLSKPGSYNNLMRDQGFSSNVPKSRTLSLLYL